MVEYNVRKGQSQIVIKTGGSARVSPCFYHNLVSEATSGLAPKLCPSRHPLTSPASSLTRRKPLPPKTNTPYINKTKTKTKTKTKSKTKLINKSPTMIKKYKTIITNTNTNTNINTNSNPPKKRIPPTLLPLLLLPTLLLTGCTPLSTPAPTPPAALIKLEDHPILDYQIPIQTPNIITDPRGYESDSIKEIYFLGDQLPEEFHLVDTSTNETVYTGFIESILTKSGNKAEDTEYNGYGEFSGFTHTGQYYIECDTLGRSYTFRIEEHLYDETFQEVTDKILYQADNPEPPLISMTEKQYEEWLNQIILLLLTYELYPDVYLDNDANQIPDILDALSTMVKDINTQIGWQQEKASYAYAAAMAKFSYLFQKVDNSYATEILNMADRAWRTLEKQKDSLTSKTQDNFYYLAAAELYRASGQSKYKKVIEEYGTQTSVSDSDAGSEWAICLAEVTYISTKQKVNMDICNRFMKRIMQQAEKIAQKHSGKASLTYQLENENDMWNMTKDMVVLSVVEYVITNHEYGQMIEDQYHYLMGRNPGSVIYWSSKDTRHQAHILNNRVWTAGFLMMLSEMLTNS